MEDLFKEGNQQLRRVAQEEVRVLTAQNKQQAASIKQLRDELELQKAMHHKHNEEVSEQVQRMKTNYHILYGRFQTHRSHDFEVCIVPGSGQHGFSCTRGAICSTVLC